MLSRDVGGRNEGADSCGYPGLRLRTKPCKVRFTLANAPQSGSGRAPSDSLRGEAGLTGCDRVSPATQARAARCVRRAMAARGASVADGRLLQLGAAGR